MQSKHGEYPHFATKVYVLQDLPVGAMSGATSKPTTRLPSHWLLKAVTNGEVTSTSAVADGAVSFEVRHIRTSLEWSNRTVSYSYRCSDCNSTALGIMLLRPNSHRANAVAERSRWPLR